MPFPASTACAWEERKKQAKIQGMTQPSREPEFIIIVFHWMDFFFVSRGLFFWFTAPENWPKQLRRVQKNSKKNKSFVWPIKSSGW